MSEYYCVKCKAKREMKDAERVTMKNGKPALKGKCAVCGTTILVTEFAQFMRIRDPLSQPAVETQR